MSMKRYIKHLVERLGGILIVKESELYALPERTHLKRFFEHFAVDCVFDVGANTGQYRDLVRNQIGFVGPIISFEPVPELARILHGKRLQDSRWFVENTALDSECGLALFNVMDDNQFSSLKSPASNQPKIFADWNKVARQISVERSTLAIELPRWQDRLGFKRPFLKLDTQGNDLAVLEGAGQALQSFVGLQSELSFQQVYKGSVNFAQALCRYCELGFQLSALVPNNVGHFPNLIEMDCIMFRDPAGHHR